MFGRNVPPPVALRPPESFEFYGIKSAESYSLGARSSGGVTISTGNTSNVIGLHFYSTQRSLSTTTGRMSCTEFFGATRNRMRLFMMTLELPHMKLISFTVDVNEANIGVSEITSRYSTDMGAFQSGVYELDRMIVIRAGHDPWM